MEFAYICQRWFKMRAKISFILITILFILKTAIPQNQFESGSKDFGFTIGLNEYQVKEKVLNNIRHRGMMPALAFSYEKSKKISRQRFEFFLIVNMLKSRYDPDRSSIVINPSINYRYARKVKDIDQDFKLFLGGIAGLNSHGAFFDNWDDSHLYWLTSYSLGIDAILTYQRSEKSFFFLEINSPVLALISRPPTRFLYKAVNPEFSWIVSEYHKNLRLTSIHEHFVLNLDLEYRFRYSKKFMQSIFWRFRYAKNSMSYSKNIDILTHTLGLTIIF
jgi:hypothetical protein